MKDLWQKYADSFLHITSREQYLIITAGVTVIFLVMFSGFIDVNLSKTAKLDDKIKKITIENTNTGNMVNILQESLMSDVNLDINNKVERVDKGLLALDDELLELTSGLIDPIQMRYALIDLLQLQSSVSLNTFEVLPPVPLNIKQDTSDTSQVEPANQLTLYKHGIKLVLRGGFFQLRDYLSTLEQLEWQFFWRSFDYQIINYPTAELHIELYSLSTKKEFLGV
jgi:MSHA biogenesis protein MshJ